MKVLIIGAGWYGCHIAKMLIDKGITVCVVDKSNNIFTGSSSKNQNRLHLGFHYPRSVETMGECLDGYYKFINKYGFLTRHIDKNLYFISSENSYMTSSSYIDIMTKHCDNFREYKDCMPLLIKNVNETVIEVEEKYIDPIMSSAYFNDIISPYFKRIHNLDAFKSIESICWELGDSYDFVINCTYNMLNPIQFDHYELFVTLLYKIDAPCSFAYTIMDGPFFSIYPYDMDNNIYTVTSVIHGVAYSGETTEFELSKGQLCDIIQKMEDQIKGYIPAWDTCAKYEGYYVSWKTKHDTKTDDRSLRYLYKNKILNIYGGKITGIFEAEKIVVSTLGLSIV